MRLGGNGDSTGSHPAALPIKLRCRLLSVGNRNEAGRGFWKYFPWMDDLAGLTHTKVPAEWMGGLLDSYIEGKIHYWLPSPHMVRSVLGRTIFSKQFVISFSELSTWLQNKCACTERNLFLYSLPLLGSLEMLQSSHVPNIPVSPREAVWPFIHYSKDGRTGKTANKGMVSLERHFFTIFGNMERHSF